MKGRAAAMALELEVGFLLLPKNVFYNALKKAKRHKESQYTL